MSRYSFKSDLSTRDILEMKSGIQSIRPKNYNMSRTAACSPNRHYLQSELDALQAFKKESNNHITKLNQHFKERQLMYEEKLNDQQKELKKLRLLVKNLEDEKVLYRNLYIKEKEHSDALNNRLSQEKYSKQDEKSLGWLSSDIHSFYSKSNQHLTQIDKKTLFLEDKLLKLHNKFSLASSKSKNLKIQTILTGLSFNSSFPSIPKTIEHNISALSEEYKSLKLEHALLKEEKNKLILEIEKLRDKVRVQEENAEEIQARNKELMDNLKELTQGCSTLTTFKETLEDLKSDIDLAFSIAHDESSNREDIPQYKNTPQEKELPNREKENYESLVQKLQLECAHTNSKLNEAIEKASIHHQKYLRLVDDIKHSGCTCSKLESIILP